MANKLSTMGKKNGKFNFNLKGTLNDGANEVMYDLESITGVGMIACPQVMSLAGLDEMDDFEYQEYLGRCSAMGRKKKTKQERKERRKKIFENIKNDVKGAFATAATKSFLVLIKAGKLTQNTKLKLNLANKMALAWQKNPNAVKDMWRKFGGNPDELKQAIMTGTGVALRGDDGWDGLSQIGSLAALLSAVTISAPVLVGAYKLFKDSGILSKEEEQAGTETIDETEDEYDERRGTPPPQKLNYITTTVIPYQSQPRSNTQTPVPSNIGGLDLSALKQHPLNIAVKGFLYAYCFTNIFPEVLAPVFGIGYIASVAISCYNYFTPKFSLKKIYSHGKI